MRFEIAMPLDKEAIFYAANQERLRASLQVAFILQPIDVGRRVQKEATSAKNI
jgi:hypothetical protein